MNFQKNDSEQTKNEGVTGLPIFDRIEYLKENNCRPHVPLADRTGKQSMGRYLNLGIVAHVDAGKTTLSEAMLYLTGRIREAGRVDHGDTHLDTDEIERERGITIFSKQARFELPGVSVTLLDTPGHTDFSAETERTLQVLDAAVLVLSGTDGVQSHTRTLWRLLAHYHVPALIFVNKMDLAGADRAALMDGIRRKLSADCVDFSAPDWEEEAATAGEDLLEKWLTEGTLSDRDVASAVGERKLFPVWFGSALKMEGVKELLDGAARFVPSRPPLPSFGMRVYKTGRDAKGVRLTFVRVTGGCLRVKDSVTYRGATSGEEGPLTEKIEQIRLYTGDRFETCEEAPAGCICAVTGLTAAVPGLGIGADEGGEEPLLLPVMTRRLLLPPDVQAADFFRQFRVMEEEDPALHIVWNEARQEIDVRIMGQVQLEVLTRMIRERFGISVSFGKERISYKETVAAPSEGAGHYEPLRHYAEVHLLLEPGDRGSGVTVASGCSSDDLDLNWQRLILTHVLERDHPGVLTGSPLTDVRVTVLGGRAHKKHTEGGDFRQATYRAVRHALKRGVTLLLEPYYDFSLEVPADRIGRAISELEGRFAEYGDPVYADDGESVRIDGSLPVSESGNLMSEVHAFTGGAGALSLVLSGYRECHNAEEMIEKIGYDSEADAANPTGSVFCAHGAGFYVPWDQVDQYMHLPYLYSPEETEETEAEAAGFRSVPAAGRSSDGVLSREEDDELTAIYAREFGRTRDGARIGDDKNRKKWKKEGGSSGAGGNRVKIDKHGNPIYPEADKRKPLLIVDGYNIIFAWEDLRILAQADLGAARGKLLDMISNYQGFTGEETIVVFDAWRTGRNPEAVSRHQNLTVVFTRENQTADAWIERTVHERCGSSRITVATSDGMEQLTVMRLGALRMPASQLREEMSRVSTEAGFSSI